MNLIFVETLMALFFHSRLLIAFVMVETVFILQPHPAQLNLHNFSFTVGLSEYPNDTCVTTVKLWLHVQFMHAKCKNCSTLYLPPFGRYLMITVVFKSNACKKLHM